MQEFSIARLNQAYLADSAYIQAARHLELIDFNIGQIEKQIDFLTTYIEAMTACHQTVARELLLLSLSDTNLRRWKLARVQIVRALSIIKHGFF